MIPTFATDDGTNRGSRNAKCARDVGVAFAIGVAMANIKNLMCLQNRSALTFAGIVCAVALSVVQVIAAGVPPQVTHPVVGVDAVVVTDLATTGGRTDECFKNQTMDVGVLSARPRVSEIYLQVADRLGRCPLEFSPRSVCSCASSNGPATEDAAVVCNEITRPSTDRLHVETADVHVGILL